MALLHRLANRLFKRECRHRFYVGSLRQTGSNDPSRRVCWPCLICGTEFYAHCGLDIAHQGNIVREAQPSGEKENE